MPNAMTGGASPNPWLALPDTKPFVLFEDKATVATWNRKHANDLRHVKTDVMPEPFVGRPDAPVVLLNGNPGYDASMDMPLHGNPQFRRLSRTNLEHGPSAFPFFLLNPEIGQLAQDLHLARAGGYQWWFRHFIRPILHSVNVPEGSPRADIIQRNVAHHALVVEALPYHSQKGVTARDMPVPSQGYSHDLVHQAIARGALLIVMRARSYWNPWLTAGYGCANPPVIYLNSAQSVYLSENNWPRNPPPGGTYRHFLDRLHVL